MGMLLAASKRRRPSRRRSAPASAGISGRPMRTASIALGLMGPASRESETRPHIGRVRGLRRVTSPPPSDLVDASNRAMSCHWTPDRCSSLPRGRELPAPRYEPVLFDAMRSHLTSARWRLNSHHRTKRRRPSISPVGGGRGLHEASVNPPMSFAAPAGRADTLEDRMSSDTERRLCMGTEVLSFARSPR